MGDPRKRETGTTVVPDGHGGLQTLAEGERIARMGTRRDRWVHPPPTQGSGLRGRETDSTGRGDACGFDPLHDVAPPLSLHGADSGRSRVGAYLFYRERALYRRFAILRAWFRALRAFCAKNKKDTPW